MREILFRGKQYETNDWLYGDYEHFHCMNKRVVVYISDWGKFNKEVDPETVGQFTGQTDKNGKKVFEADIIRFHKFRNEPDWVGVISYENCHYIATGRMPLAYEKRIGEKAFFSPFEVAISGIDKETIEVIGNIHDNPELLEDLCV